MTQSGTAARHESTGRAVFLARAEIRRSLRQPANAKFLLLLPFAILLSEWPYVGSLLVPVFLFTFIGLEPNFNNLLFREDHEFESMATLPTHWREFVLMKNIATGALSLMVSAAGVAIIGYFSAFTIRPAEAGEGVGYYLSVIFGMLIIGNLHSIQHPRRMTGMTISDLADALLMLPTLGVLSIPYLLLSQHVVPPIWLIVYILALFLLWIFWSVPHTAGVIRREQERLCQTA